MDDSMLGVERGCGVREPGGIYAEVRTSKYGRPVEDFLFDPPLPVGGLDIPARGVLIMERPDGSGVFDVYDRVGEKNYPNVADMVEEIRRFGVSRRLGKSLDFSKLTKRSMIFLLHPNAILTNAHKLYLMLDEYQRDTPDHVVKWACPCGKPEHDDFIPAAVEEGRMGVGAPTCAGVWWETLTKAEPIYDLDAPRRSCTRQSGSTKYVARHSPHGFKPEWEEGIFARFRITNLAVIADPEGGQDEVAHKRLENTGLPIIDCEA